MVPRPPITCRMLSPEAFLALSPSAESFPILMRDFLYNPNTQMFCAFAEEELVGVVKLAVSGTNTHVEFLETSASSRKRGVAKEMMYQLFDYAKEHDATLTSQGFTDDGRNYLLKELARLESKFPGRFHLIPNM